MLFGTPVAPCMQYRDNTVGFVLNHQEFCEVLEPEWLKEEFVRVSKEILNEFYANFMQNVVIVLTFQRKHDIINLIKS